MLWAPRLLAAAVSLFLSVFALDAFDGGATFAEALPDFLMHLIPSATLLGVVALSWRREWIGAVAFVGLAVAYAIPAYAHLSWIVTISGPLLVVGALYAWNWMHRKTGG
jgi:general stress protein CsbA